MNSTTKCQRTRPPNANPDPPVTVQHYQPNWEDPGAEVWKRIESFGQQFPTALFLNPRATVSCDVPTPLFFRTVRKIQGKWCQLCSTTFARRVRRSVKDWGNALGTPKREVRYWDRAACLIGILLVNGEFTPPHQWPDRKPKRRKRPKQSNSAVAKNTPKSAKDSIPGIDRKVKEESFSCDRVSTLRRKRTENESSQT